MRGPVGDWPTLDRRASPRRKVRRKQKPEPTGGPCPVCGVERYSAAAYLCARCWAVVPREFVEVASATARALEFGDAVRHEYGKVAPEWGYTLADLQRRRRRDALLLCEIAAALLR